MNNVSIGISQDFMVGILIRNVRVRRTIIGYASYTDKQHHGISAYLLARIFGIEVDKANFTLQSTT